MASFMGRVNYNLPDRYLLTISVRYDGSSTLAQGNKWALCPIVAFAWRMNEEKLLRKISWLNNLKLRLEYGITGNSVVSPYQTKGGYVYGNDSAEVIGLLPGLMANGELILEETEQ
jgi:hypothetical protein